jgi:hypothetical protein
MRHALKTTIITGLFVVVLTPLLFATQLQLMTAREMAERSERIVAGTVTRVESFWNEKHTKIYTRTTIAVDETYKGTRGGTVDILQLGGVVGNVRVTVDGAIAWKKDEEVLLFLEPYVQGTYQVTGLSQGKFEIERDPETGERFVSREAIEGVEIVGLAAEGEDARGPGARRISLERFVSDALRRTE